MDVIDRPSFVPVIGLTAETLPAPAAVPGVRAAPFGVCSGHA